MHRKKILILYVSTLLGVIFWLSLTFLAPYLRSQESSLSALIYAVFSPICHQVDSRCFQVFGHPVAVCIRCLGVYVGFLLGTIIYPFLRGFEKVSLPRTRNFILVSLPIVVDTGGNFLTLWATPGTLRLIFGLMWGLILPFYFISGIADFIMSLHQRTKDHTQNP